MEELFSSCAVVSVFCSGGKEVLVLHTNVHYLTIFLQTNIFLIVVEVLAKYVFWRVFTFVNQIMTRKKRYKRLAISWNKSQITVCCVKIRTPPITL
jgi:hypothetical protein